MVLFHLGRCLVPGAVLLSLSAALAGEVPPSNRGIPPAASLVLAPPLQGDGVSFRDGSVLVAEVLGMEEGVLKLKLASGPETEANWAQVIFMRSAKPHVFITRSGERYEGTVRTGDLAGSIWSAPPTGRR